MLAHVAGSIASGRCIIIQSEVRRISLGGVWNERGVPLLSRRSSRDRLQQKMMAARALARLQRANPKISPVSTAIAHRCTLPAVVRLGGVTGGDSGCREEQQRRREIGTGSSSRAKALTVLRRRDIHATTRNENTVLLAGLGIAASAMAARYGLQAYNDWKVGGTYAASDNLLASKWPACSSLPLTVYAAWTGLCTHCLGYDAVTCSQISSSWVQPLQDVHGGSRLCRCSFGWASRPLTVAI